MSDSFIPKFASATAANPAGSSASVSLAPECPDVRLMWRATTARDSCQVIWGIGTQTATTAHMDMADGATEVFTKQNADTLAVIGTGKLSVVCGTGK